MALKLGGWLGPGIHFSDLFIFLLSYSFFVRYMVLEQDSRRRVPRVPVFGTRVLGFPLLLPFLITDY